MDKGIYIYPAVITKFDNNDYNVRFPDFEEITTYGETLEEAYLMAEDALKLVLFDLYQEDKDIPVCTELERIIVEKNQTIAMIKVNLQQTIREYDNKAVKKTLTIPAWLNKEAEKSHLNYSHLLQEAIKKQLEL